MRRAILKVVVWAASAAPCFAGTPPHEAPIVIVGSSTVTPFASLVATHFARSSGFPTPSIRSTGTREGIREFCAAAGTAPPDVVGASRPMSAAERADCAAHGVHPVREIRIGYDSLVLANPVGEPRIAITLGQLWRAVAKYVPVDGRFVLNPYQRWRDIDARLPDRPIRLLGPAPGRGTRDALAELVMEPACRATEAGRRLAPEGVTALCGAVRDDGRYVALDDLELALGQLAAERAAYAVLPYSYLEQFGSRIQAATVDGVAPSRATLPAGGYPIVRPLFVYVNEARIATTPGVVDYVAEFLSFCASGNHGYLSDEGLVPLPIPELLEQRARAAAMQRGKGQ
ncbi:MAG: substrate-binding domain-containing protein [Proteobacteria bacterium]|nr:substrate-binding domain-containing protein [Pseudomonadota bacterium]